MPLSLEDIACLVAKAELAYARMPGGSPDLIRETVVKGGEVIVYGTDRKVPLARFRAGVSRCRVWVERIS